jgi:magnesium-transporting ATPase (P-type)
MGRPPRRADLPLLTNSTLAKIGVAGGFTAVAALALMLTHDGSFEHTAWLAYTTLVVGQCVRAYWNRSVREPIHRLKSNRFLLGACVAAVVVQVLIPLIPPIAEAFRATPLDLTDWLFVAVVAFLPAAAAEIGRWRGRADTVWVA